MRFPVSDKEENPIHGSECPWRTAMGTRASSRKRPFALSAVIGLERPRRSRGDCLDGVATEVARNPTFRFSTGMWGSCVVGVDEVSAGWRGERSRVPQMADRHIGGAQLLSGVPDSVVGG